MHLVVDDKIPYIRGLAEQLGTVDYLPGAEISAADVLNADALIVRTRTHCNKALLEHSKVKFIATATIGYDHLDIEYLHRAGILWTNCPGCNATSVAQYVESCLLILQQQGKVNFAECTIGVVGVGNVGRVVAERVANLGIKVLLCDPPRQEREGGNFVSLEYLAKHCDVISFHTPLTYDGKHPTFHLADKTFFHNLARPIVLLNAGRGEAVDTAALLMAMNKGLVAEAIIDTWENEPNISTELLQRAFVATPHIAGYSADGKANGTRMALNAVARFFGIWQTFDVQPPLLSDKIVPAEHEFDRRLQLYNPLNDTLRLKKNPEKFEWLRGNYPLRREHF